MTTFLFAYNLYNSYLCSCTFCNFFQSTSHNFMKISYNWLKQHIDLKENPEEIGKILTAAGLEVESIEPFDTIKGGLQGLVIGEVLTKEKHPNAEKLSLTTVNIGNDTIVPIVCGAANVAAGQKVVVATVGATLYPIEGEAITIKKAKIRGEASEGMICAEDEIGLGKEHEGIMVLETALANGTPAAQYFGLETDYIFEIGLTPNRADAASHYGVARDLRVLLNRELCKTSLHDFKVENQDLTIKVAVENTTACPRYAGITISNVTVKESPTWLKNRLKSIGLNPINNIVDITNFILHAVGQPLHAFDAHKLKGKTLIVKNLVENTVFKTLDSVERKLAATDLMICDGESNPLCIGGVFGGLESGISDSTTHIFLESAYFSPETIRKTSQLHGLKTDASFRFERGTNPDMVIPALKHAALLIKELAGGEISSDIVDLYPNPIKPFDFLVKYANINRLIGKEIDKHFIKRTLKALEINILSENNEGLRLSVPPYRVDVQREADIAEEILRIYGFNQVELSDNLATSYLAAFPAIDSNKVRYKTANLLASNGFYEIITNSLTKPSYAAAVGLAAENNVEILNALSGDLGVMRQSLVQTGLEIVAYNINRRQKDLKLFEFGKVYHKTTKITQATQDSTETTEKVKYAEKVQLALYLTGNQTQETWQHKSQKTTFYDLGEAIVKILQSLNVVDYQQVEIQADDSYNSHIFAYGTTVVWRKKEIARLGLLKPTLTKQSDIKQEVFYAEIEWDYLAEKLSNKFNYSELSKFPEVRRDLSLVLDRAVSFDQIQKLAMQTEKNLLQKVNIFDVYEGENIGADKKSYSVSFMLNDKEQTLTEETIDKVMAKLIKVYEEKLQAVIRK
jgi:phenylalanyl-tRNA synthetase beta chain